MKILFNDVIQYSDAPAALKTSMLSDFYEVDGDIIITFDGERFINSIGIGGTDGRYFKIVLQYIAGGQSYTYHTENINFKGSGLYYIKNIKRRTGRLIIITDATYIGRIAAGMACNIPTSVTKEPALKSTSEPRKTLAGGIIPGAGGYNYRALSLDNRYKINKEIMLEFEAGYKYIGMGYPFFIDLTDESYKLTYSKLYASEKSQISTVFQSGVHKFLYSKRFEFEECF